MAPIALPATPAAAPASGPGAPRRRGLARGEAHRLAVLAYQQRHLAAGLCMVCPRPAVSAHYCEVHRKRINSQRRAGARTLRCGCCGRRGHNRRTCPQDAAA